MNNELNKEIVQWIQLDEQIKGYNKKISELKELKDSKYDLIYDKLNVDDKNIDDLPKYKIEKYNSMVYFNTSVNYSSLTYRYLENCLNEYFKDAEEVQKMMEYIKGNRKRETRLILKRDSII
jgi:hypothetical protein